MSLKEKIKEKYEKTKNQVSEKAHNARSYANFYGGPVLTSGGTIAFLRYSMFSGYQSPVSEAFKWAWAAVVSLPYQIVSIPIGVALGVVSSVQLAESRAKKKPNLETTICKHTGLPNRMIKRKH